MDIVRTVARPMLASTFIFGGYSTLKDPGSRTGAAEKVTRPLAGSLPVDLPDDTEQLVKINAAVQLGAGALLAIGRFPRLSALALAASLAPTTFAGHRFWEATDDRTRTQQLIHFLKNASMFGGLLITALDTEGRPSVGYRAKRASGRARTRAERAAATAQTGAARSRAATANVASTTSARLHEAQAAVAKGAASGAGSVISALPVGH
jgi:putative oxidoreductase